MKQIWAALQNGFVEILGVLLLLGVYIAMAQQAGLPHGSELKLFEMAREAFTTPHHFYAFTVNHQPAWPVSPILAVFYSMLFWMTPAILAARLVVLVIAVLTLGVIVLLGGRLFHGGVGLLAAAFWMATWGFFANSHIANGAMLYILLVCAIMVLFFHWFDSAFRSRTYARSLYLHFSSIGLCLGLAFCTYGLPGLFFPLVVMLTTIFLSSRPEVLDDIRYIWLWVPLGITLLVAIIFGCITAGIWPFWLHILYFSPRVMVLLQPATDLLPLLFFFIPALLAKDLWGRALLTYSRPILLLGAWFVWAWLFLALFSDLAAGFSLLIGIPPMLWLAYYLNEIFKNPGLPHSLHIVLDGMILLGLILGMGLILLTMQIVPPKTLLVPSFWILAFTCPLLSVIYLLFRDIVTSRFLFLSFIPVGLLLCSLVQLTIVPLVNHPDYAPFIPYLHAEIRNNQRLGQVSSVMSWQENAAEPPGIRLFIPLASPVDGVSNQAQLEAAIQTRQGPAYLILPESEFYNLPYSVREHAFQVGRSWHWRTPLTLGTMLSALHREMLDFTTLSEPVYLVKIDSP